MEPQYTPAWIPWFNDDGVPGSMRRLITLLGNRTDVTVVSNQSNSFRAAAEDGLAVAGKRGHTLTPRSRAAATSGIWGGTGCCAATPGARWTSRR